METTPPAMSRRALVALGPLLLGVALLLVAGGLRFARLDAQSLWYDEGNTARLVERGIEPIIRNTMADIHPPGYYILAAGWYRLTGDSEFALRSFSALAGLLSVAVVIRLGLAYFDARAALLAGALAALHTGLVYYSQEARMYSLLGLAAALTFLLMTRWLKATRSRPVTHPLALRLGLAYALVATLGLYTHYAYTGVLVAVNLAALGGLAFHRRAMFAARLRGWVAANALALLLFGPWLPVMWRHVTGWPTGGDALPLGAAVLGILDWTALGHTLPHGGWLWLARLAALTLLGLGLRRDGQTITPLFGWLIPVGGVLAAGLFSDAFAKFLIIAVPFALLLLGNGLAALWPERASTGVQRWLPVGLAAVAGLALLGGYGYALNALYTDPAFARADYRQIAADIQADAQPGDAVILNAPNQWEVFTYYYPNGPNVFPVARTRPLDEAGQLAELETIVGDYDRLFVLYWGEAQSDPNRFVESWLNANTFKATDTWYKDVRLSVYAVPDTNGTLDTSLDVRFGESITLEGYSIDSDPLHPGDILQVTLFWRSDAELSERYKVFLHVVPAIGTPPVAQRDSEPGGALLPTTVWVPGEQVRDGHGVLLPRDMAPGDYLLLAGLYDIDSGTRLATNGTDYVVLDTVRVE